MYNSKLGNNLKLSSKGYGDFVVVEDSGSRNVIIEFVGTGTKRVCRRADVINGSVFDPYYPKVAGIGFTGEGVYTHSKAFVEGKISASRASTVWASMLKRCYSADHKDFKHYGEQGVFVCEDWHNFQEFAKWYTQWDNCSGFEIDKDLLFIGNKEYCPSRCILVPKDINRFFRNAMGAESKDNLPLGVILPKLTDRKNHRTKPYVGTWKKSPLFKTAEDCHLAYIEYRLKRLEHLCEKYSSEIEDDRFLPAMLDRISILNYHLENKLTFNGW